MLLVLQTTRFSARQGDQKILVGLDIVFVLSPHLTDFNFMFTFTS